MADRAGIAGEFTFGKGGGAVERSETPFRMLVMGDFGGHQARGELRGLRDLRPRRVDLDSFATVMGAIAPRLSIAVGDQPPFELAVSELDHFHPDHLFRTLDFFAPMRELRRQLQDGQAFERAAALLGQASAATASPPAASDADLERLLGRAGTGPAPVASPLAAVDALVRRAVAPHVVGKADPRQAQLIAAVDGMSGELMRALLHDPAFQRLEALWRGLDRLVRGLELDESLQLFVLDVSRAELAADFAASDNLSDSALYRVFVGHNATVPWSLLVHAAPCSRRVEDAVLLGRLGALAQEVDASVVAGLDWQAWLSEVDSLEEQRACAALRSSPAASSIAVATPGMLLRLPYGKGGEPVESFAFTEQTSLPAHERYLWGSAGFALAELLAKSFSEAGGWDFSPGDNATLEDLPVHVFNQDGDSEESPPTQAWVTEAKADQILKDGFVPMMQVKGRGQIRVPRIQSIASPPAALSGRWS
jgi:type VI secretion system protein ImpC